MQLLFQISILLSFIVFSPTSLIFAAFEGDITVEELRQRNHKSTKDLDFMIEKRLIRVLMPYSKTFFFFDGIKPKGLSYDGVMQFEQFLNKKLKKNNLKVGVLVIPTSRDKLLSKLKEGYGDIAVGNLTITENRLKHVDFSDPFLSDVDEIIVTHKKVKTLKNLFDLSGKEIHVRKSSSYYDSLLNLNKVLNSAGKPSVKIKFANEHLEDEDLLEMLNAGVIPMMVVDKHKGDFWAKIFSNIKIHSDIKVNTGGSIGWAVRKENIKLKQVINEYVLKNKKGTLKGNISFNKYLKDTKYITNSLNGDEFQRFSQTIDLFIKYGKKYDFDYLMLAALAFQESRLDQNVKSQAGAVGVMQILPTTAKDKNVNIHGIDKLEPNIHAGTKYLRFMADRYFGENSEADSFNRALFSFAAYNAGPAKVAKMRIEAEKLGLDPNVWFNNVEIVAAKRIGRETVQYVSNILKYYVAYKLVSEKNNISKTDT